MQAVAFADGDTLFRSGEETGHGFLVLAGRVDLRDGSGRVVAAARPGDVVGELAALFGHAHDLTAVADGPVEAFPVDRAAIEDAVARDRDGARLLARQMLNGLGLAVQLPGATAGGTVAPDGWQRMVIRPDSPQARAQVPADGMEIATLPFNLGREPGESERRARVHVHLLVHDEKPYNISRHHLSIEAGRDALMVRDVGSQLGTTVNGMRIGTEEAANVANLRPGDNVVWAGGISTPWRFIVTVET